MKAGNARIAVTMDRMKPYFSCGFAVLSIYCMLVVREISPGYALPSGITAAGFAIASAIVAAKLD